MSCRVSKSADSSSRAAAADCENSPASHVMAACMTALWLVWLTQQSHACPLVKVDQSLALTLHSNNVCMALAFACYTSTGDTGVSQSALPV